MHVQMIVTFKKKHAKTSERAGDYAFTAICPDRTTDKPITFRGQFFDFISPIDDDPQIIDQTLYKEHLQAHEGQTDDSKDVLITFADLDKEPVSPSFVGTKWLVPVWYHL
jgi:hypothetical protein